MDNFTFITTIFSATKKSDWLRWAYVEEIPLEECREVYEKALNATSERRRSAFLSGITDDVVCAKNREKLVDACQGNHILLVLK